MNEEEIVNLKASRQGASLEELDFLGEPDPPLGGDLLHLQILRVKVIIRKPVMDVEVMTIYGPVALKKVPEEKQEDEDPEEEVSDKEIE